MGGFCGVFLSSCFGSLHLLEIGAFACLDCVDAILGPRSEGGKFVLDRLGAVAILTEVGEENLAPRWLANRL